MAGGEIGMLDRRTTLVLLGGAAGGLASASVFLPSGGGAHAEARPDLYDCEGCQAVGERAPDMLSARVSLAPPEEPGARMHLTGRIFAADGRTPAPGVIVYAHHTNARGLYADGTGETEWSRRHGRLRGWARTGADGTYAFDTIKPAPYPDMTMPAHVHLFIGEPGRRPYYVDDLVFDGEFGVTPAYRARQELRGGSGIVRLGQGEGGVLLARRNIRLERHPDAAGGRPGAA
jgi:protocatechuate 3,4-dioxygenase beta subunit